jgi:hypothetical protein
MALILVDLNNLANLEGEKHYLQDRGEIKKKEKKKQMIRQTKLI